VATNLALDDALIERAKLLGKHRSKREAVDEALRQYVASHERRRLLERFGTVEMDPKYHYKRERSRAR
jgi:Arc/MetJ family transcription regulator